MWSLRVPIFCSIEKGNDCKLCSFNNINIELFYNIRLFMESIKDAL